MLGGNPKEDLGWSLRIATSLLPILKSAHADSEERGKLRLGEAVLVPEGSYVGIIELRLARRALLASQNRSALLHAPHELAEQVFLHLNSSSTKAASTFLCSGDKSSRSLFGYINSIRIAPWLVAQ